MARNRTLPKLAAACAVFAAAGIAASAVLQSSNAGPARPWSFGGGVPGNPIQVDSLAQQAAAYAGVDVASIRSVIATADLKFLAGLSPGGVCFAAETADTMLGFECLTDLLETKPDRAFVVRFELAGSASTAASSIRLVGIARGDVTRIEVQSVGGRSTSLSLNAFGGFAYSTQAHADVAVALNAYGPDGALIESMPISIAPPDSRS